MEKEIKIQKKKIKIITIKILADQINDKIGFNDTDAGLKIA